MWRKEKSSTSTWKQTAIPRSSSSERGRYTDRATPVSSYIKLLEEEDRVAHLLRTCRFYAFHVISHVEEGHQYTKAIGHKYKEIFRPITTTWRALHVADGPGGPQIRGTSANTRWFKYDRD